MNDYFLVDDGKGGTVSIRRVDFYKQKLKPMLDKIAEEIRVNNARPKPLPLVFTSKIYQELMCLFLTDSRISNDEAAELTAETITRLKFDFLELMKFINDVVDYIPNKQIFAAYAGITITAYNSLLKSRTEGVAEEMQTIEDYLVGSQTTGAQDGVVSANTTKFMLQAKGQGHGITKAVDTGAIAEVVELLAPGAMNMKLASLRARNNLPPGDDDK